MCYVWTVIHIEKVHDLFDTVNYNNVDKIVQTQMMIEAVRYTLSKLNGE